jgi:DNA-binding MarR family transcriptional regulator
MTSISSGCRTKIGASADHAALSELARDPFFVMRRAARAVTEYLDSKVRASGLKSTEFMLLCTVLTNPGVPVGEIARIIVADASTVSAQFRRLRRRRLLSAGRPLTGIDRRTVAMSLTSRGYARLERALPLWLAASQELEAVARPALSNSLDKLATLLQVREQSAGSSVDE